MVAIDQATDAVNTTSSELARHRATRDSELTAAVLRAVVAEEAALVLALSRVDLSEAVSTAQQAAGIGSPSLVARYALLCVPGGACACAYLTGLWICAFAPVCVSCTCTCLGGSHVFIQFVVCTCGGCMHGGLVVAGVGTLS